MRTNTSCSFYENNTNFNQSHQAGDDEFGDENPLYTPIFSPKYDIIGILMTLIIVLLNSWVFVLVAKKRSLRTPTNFFLVGLAASDFLTGLISLPLSITCNIFHEHGICFTTIYIWMFTSFLAVSHISAVTADRFIAIVFSLRYPQIVTRRRTYIALGFLWASSLLVSLMQLWWLRPTNYDPHESVPEDQRHNEIAFSIACFVVYLGIPVAFMAFTYLMILREVRRQSRRLLAMWTLRRLSRPLGAFRRLATSRNEGFLSRLEEELQSMRTAGTFKVERVLSSPQSGAVTVVGGSEPVLNFCANNYLGLSSHPALIQAAQATLASHGFGLSSVRFICGTQDVHKQLEAAISTFHGTEDTILFPSCFDANAGLFEACLGPEDAVISDALNHASIIDGIRLCKAQRHRYNHMDMAHLEEILRECVAKGTRQRMIVTDGVFSMDGDIAPLREICDLADKYEAQVFVDECHATGFLGATGRGTPELCGVSGRVDIINSTLGKALGGATGGYTTGPKALIDLLRNKARPYLFSNTLAPSVAGASLEVFKMLSDSAGLLSSLQANVQHFRSSMKAAGFKLSGHESCPIIPVMLGDARLATEMADEMLKRGIYVIGFSYPVVPKGAARIRVQMSAAHQPEQVQRCIDAFIEVGKAKGVI